MQIMQIMQIILLMMLGFSFPVTHYLRPFTHLTQNFIPYSLKTSVWGESWQIGRETQRQVT